MSCLKIILIESLCKLLTSTRSQRNATLSSTHPPTSRRSSTAEPPQNTTAGPFSLYSSHPSRKKWRTNPKFRSRSKTKKKTRTRSSTRRLKRPSSSTLGLPTRIVPDDRYWFCLRVGCDQKHEEEMDSEAIYKNFILRVMAARSPNIRLRKALNRKASGSNIKCPLSAPPKSSKSRVSKLAVVSSLSQKMGDDKANVMPLTKLSATPKAKSKQVAAKYLTTPRNKKCPPNPNSFKSVQNPNQQQQ
ncbi:unnamed protein product [Ilex paraguariensis]|uniref:Uncharacterized protein n=1 Tax=Ilex paraguariensis TaxID=185542 RepID=A0ABC8S1Y2_9AQUA